MGTPEPFSILKLECPVCGAINLVADIRPMSYRETGTDTDFYPLGRVWHNATYQAHDPLWYFMATCAECFYTHELTPEFKGWAKDATFKSYRQAAVRDKHLAASAANNGIVQFLGSRIDADRYPTESAIIKFVLGIYDELTTDRTSSLNVGRYFLRAAWLFRSQTTPGETEGDPAAALAKRLRGMVSDADHALRAYDQKVSVIKTAFQNDAAAVLEDISASIAALQRSHAELAKVCEAVELTAPSNASGAAAFHEFVSFEQFLLKARQLWKEVPSTEHEALLSACAYYKQAYETGSDIKEGVGQVQAAYMIAELSRRTGDFTTAENYFSTMLKVGSRLATSPTENAATVNRTRKLLELGRDQARLNKDEQAAADDR